MTEAPQPTTNDIPPASISLSDGDLMRLAITLAAANDRIVKEGEAAKLTGLSRMTRYRLSRDGLFPPKIKISGGVWGYKLSTIQAWLATK